MKEFAVVTILFGLICPLVTAQEQTELERLNELYLKELERVTNPLHEGYRNALLRLQKAYTTAAKLDDALAVRKEIERFDAESTPAQSARASLSADDGGNATNWRRGGSELKQWKGDGRVSGENGEEILTIAATTSERRVERTYNVEDFRDGMLLKFRYRTSDYTGTGLKLMGYNTPTGHFHRVIALPNDGEWREYECPYKPEQYMSARSIRMVVEVQPGAGDVEIKDLRVEEL